MAEFPDALIEQAARALYEASPADPFVDWDNTDRGIREVYRREARAVLLAVAPAIEANALRTAGSWRCVVADVHLTDLERRWLWQAGWHADMEPTHKAVERIIAARMADAWDEGMLKGYTWPTAAGSPPPNPYRTKEGQ